MQILEAATGQAIAQMTTERAQLLEKLSGLEDWVTQAATLPNGMSGHMPEPVTATPGLVRGVVEVGMSQVGCLCITDCAGIMCA